MTTQRHPAREMVLAVNAGSTSVKFSMFDAHTAGTSVLFGVIEKIGKASVFRIDDGDRSFSRQFAIPDHVTAVNVLSDWLVENIAASDLVAIGHRVVYGGTQFRASQVVTPGLMDGLFAARSYDHEHLPQEQLLIETLGRAFPAAVHVVCFDTEFHKGMPRIASMLPIPRRFYQAGVQRLGFHGLSCAFLIRELERTAGQAAAKGKVILAHLGGGCSVTAVSGGNSIDTSMGLTPAGGLMMATRSGDVDPGLAWRLMREHDVSVSQFIHLMNHDSGLLGVSGISGDLRELLDRQISDSSAADAVAMFCYQARKQIGGMTCALEGLDTLVFSGGIGENLAAVRARICEGLAFLGIEIEPTLNAEHACVISTRDSAVTVRVIASDEQVMIAEETRKFLTTSDDLTSIESSNG